MKHKILLLELILIIPFLIYAQNVQTVSLNNGWQFAKQGTDKWFDAEVPGSVQRDLVRLGELPDPFYGTNEKKVQQPENENWDFRKTFTVTDSQLKYDDAIISFEGLDTHTDVFLNGSRIIRSENMFIGYQTSVKSLLKEGENQLYIRFYSPIEIMMPTHITTGYDYPAGNDHRKEKLSVYNRKAPYQFGWDWGMRLVQIGIWRPVSLTFYNHCRIDDFYVKQRDISAENAALINQITLFSVNKNATDATLQITYGLKDEHFKQTISKKIEILPGNNQIDIPLNIANPKRWMPIHSGKQYLYDFTAKILIDNREIASKSERVGLRKVKLVQEKDKYGVSFYFKVNDTPIFAKGGNYIPGETLRTEQDSAYYQQLFDNLTKANMNFVRVWGGGTYEDDYFYQLADEKGILVWQDFMFACVPYPSDDAFLENVKNEVVYNIKRLRNHASLALWCGNNEIEEALKYWGWDKEYSKETVQEWKNGYDKTFRKLIPEMVRHYDGTRSYIHGSPFDANWGRTESFSRSDVHDWGLWYGHLPFEALADRLPRFASEFGFQSFPEMKVIRSFAPKDQWSLDSEVMKVHQKASTGNSLIKKYMDMYYHEPKNFEDFVYIGLIMQGNGMHEAIEAMRRGRPYCMGSLYWQINDSWPVVSWSSVDYYNNWKPLHYRVRAAYAPLALGVKLNADKLDYYTMTDYLNDVRNLTLNIQIIDFNGKLLKKIKTKVTAKANESKVVYSCNVNDFLTEAQKHRVVVHAWLENEKKEIVSTRNFYFYWANKLDLPQTKIKTSVTYNDGKYTVTLLSKKLAKDVFVEIPIQGAQFSDNFFDLLPGVQKTIVITHPNLKASEKTAINIKHVRETY